MSGNTDEFCISPKNKQTKKQRENVSNNHGVDHAELEDLCFQSGSTSSILII